MKKIAYLKRKRGFTLVELVVVIGVIGVLLGILIPTLVGAVTSARTSSANTTAKDIRNCLNTWLIKQDVKHNYPSKLNYSAGGLYIVVKADNGVYLDPEYGGDFWASTTDSITDLNENLKETLLNELGYRRMYAVGYLDRGEIKRLYYFDGSDAPPGVPAFEDWDAEHFWPGTPGMNTEGYVIGTSPAIVK